MTMVETAAAPKKRVPKIPESFIYEMMDGQPIYYRGWREAVRQKKHAEQIMGSSEIQSYLIAVIQDFFHSRIGETWRILYSELGIHLEHGDNFAADLAFFPKKTFFNDGLTNRYTKKIPALIIEVDTKADPGEPGFPDYFHRKIQKLLDWGVPQVIWVFSRTQKVVVAQNGSPWQTVDWSVEVEALGQVFSIQKLLEEDGFEMSFLNR